MLESLPYRACLLLAGLLVAPSCGEELARPASAGQARPLGPAPAGGTSCRPLALTFSDLPADRWNQLLQGGFADVLRDLRGARTAAGEPDPLAAGWQGQVLDQGAGARFSLPLTVDGAALRAEYVLHATRRTVACSPEPHASAHQAELDAFGVPARYRQAAPLLLQALHLRYTRHALAELDLDSAATAELLCVRDAERALYVSAELGRWFQLDSGRDSCGLARGECHAVSATGPHRRGFYRPDELGVTGLFAQLARRTSRLAARDGEALDEGTCCLDLLAGAFECAGAPAPPAEDPPPSRCLEVRIEGSERLQLQRASRPGSPPSWVPGCARPEFQRALATARRQLVQGLTRAWRKG